MYLMKQMNEKEINNNGNVERNRKRKRVNEATTIRHQTFTLLLIVLKKYKPLLGSKTDSLNR